MSYSIRNSLPVASAAVTIVLGLAACAPGTTTEPAVALVEPEERVKQAPVVQPAPRATESEDALQEQLGSSRLHAAAPAALRKEQKLATTPVPDAWRPPAEPLDRERYQHFDDNPVKRVAEHPVSTFSIDVDTGAYSNLRRVLNAGHLPREDAVRVEELVNYFSYDYPVPDGADRPFSIHTEMGPAPWNDDSRLVQIGIQGYQLPATELPPANLVFLVDVSGSMQAPNKLELLKSSLKLLVRQLGPEDRIAIAVYAGASGVVLEPVAGTERYQLEQALDSLRAGGSTNGGAGIQLAYRLAEQSFIKDGINRVILATDGDFNVGTVDFEALKDLVERKRKSGIALTTLGFGTGNYNDHLMEQLADVGNGNYAYIDTLHEAQKVLVDQRSATLHTIASDVKIQVEFNPAVVSEYRLIGYENRALRREDFTNDRVDAGEVGAGHSVTALYEVALARSGGQRLPALRYQREQRFEEAGDDELGVVRVRYKRPGESSSRQLEQVLHTRDMNERLAASSERFRFASAVAGFGQYLRGGRYLESYGLDEVHALAAGSKGQDPFGYRGEFLQLVRLAQGLAGETSH